MVDAFRLSTDTDGADRILKCVLNGLVLLVHHDTFGVYVVDGGKPLCHT